jgi:hypothetical protein
MTSEFMSDTSVDNAATLLSYGLNTEVSFGDQANFANSRERRSATTQADQRVNPQGAQRVRGLAEATLTRDYFLTSIPFDTYNTTEVTINRGPNSLLFGVGTPGGTINNGLKRATLGRDFGSVSFRVGEHSSHRATLDYNKVLVEDRIAIRVAAVNSDTQFHQRPAFQEDERYFVSLNLTLFKNENVDWLGETRLRFDYEDGKSWGTPPDNIPIVDSMSHWFALPDNMNEIIAMSGWDPNGFAQGGFVSKHTVNNVDGGNETGDVRAFTPANSKWQDNWSVVYPNLSATETSVGLPDASIDGYQARVNWQSDPTAPISERTGLFYSANVFDLVPGFTANNIIDPSIYDNRRLLLDGLNDSLVQEFDVVNARLEQLFLDGKAGIEIALNREDHQQDAETFFGDMGSGMMIDINEMLPNGMPNPNLGRPLILTAGRGETDDGSRVSTLRERETEQATAFYTLDFAENDRFGWLGTHTFTGFFGSQSLDTTFIDFRGSWVDIDGSTDVATYLNDEIGDYRRTVFSILYTGPSLQGANSAVGQNMNTYFKGLVPQKGYDGTYTMQYQPRRAPVWTGDPNNRLQQADFGVGEFPRRGSSRSLREIDSEALTVQSKLFGGHLVGLFGWRTDELTDTDQVDIDVYRETNPELDSRFRFPSGIFDVGALTLGERPEDKTTLEGDTFSWSMVAHKPAEWMKLPNDMGFSLHYSEAENFSASGVRRSILGDVIPAPTGTTTDYGFTLSSADNRLSMRVNWFESKNQFATASDGFFVGAIQVHVPTRWKAAELNGLSFEEAMANDLATTGIDHSAQFSNYQGVYDALFNLLPPEINSTFMGFDDENPAWDFYPGQSTTRDFVAEGLEVEFAGQLTENWTMLLNVGKQESVTSNSWPVAGDIVLDIRQQLQSSPLGSLTSDPDTTSSGTRDVVEWFTEDVANQLTAARAKDNTVSQEQRKWRANLVSNYSFNEGRFKGFQVGGALRYQGKVATGYPITVNDGIILPTVDSPFFGPSEINGDVWIKYGRPINDRIDWQVQLNVRNAYRSNGDDFIPVLTNPDGRHAIYRNPNPREFYLTNTFSF